MHSITVTCTAQIYFKYLFDILYLPIETGDVSLNVGLSSGSCERSSKSAP